MPRELLVSTLAQGDALVKLLIERGIITHAEFMEKLSQERAVYQRDAESDGALEGVKLTRPSTEPILSRHLCEEYRLPFVNTEIRNLEAIHFVTFLYSIGF